MLFWAVLVGTGGQTFAQDSPANATIVSTLPTASAFTNVYGIYGTNFITIAPWTSQGIFYQGDPVTISNRIGTTVEVYDLHGNRVTNAAPPVTLTNLRLGHYFIQVDGNATSGGLGDRSQFSVWPKGYTNYPHQDIQITSTQTMAESNRTVRLAPAYSKDTEVWSGIYTNYINSQGSNVCSNVWTVVDTYLHGGPCLYPTMYGNGENCVTAYPVKHSLSIVIDHYDFFPYGNHTNSYASPLVDQTNTLSSWVNDVAALYSNAAVRYTNSFIYEIFNEPDGGAYIGPIYYSTISFPTNQDPYDVPANNNTPGTPSYYGVSLAVSASVQAIHFVCTNCQVWAPAKLGLNGDPWGLTDSFVRAGYSKVNAISFHTGETVYGPADATLGYDNWTSTDSNLAILAKMYGKPFAITETYPWGPDTLGKTNGWWTGYPRYPWNWQTMTLRFWKSFIMDRSLGLLTQMTWPAVFDADISAGGGTFWTTDNAQDTWTGWDVDGEPWDIYGCGPLPKIDGPPMISWWLTGGASLMNWLSGTVITYDTPTTISNGVPGLHFWTWQFADGTTNTFVWADEVLSNGVSTNFGVGLTDIFSNEWTGPIGIEPVIAWGWPNNSRGGSFSIVPVAAFSATPTNGLAPLTVTFTDHSAGAITGRSWQFGDGFVTNTPELTVIHRYATPGSNTVQLIVSGPSGASTNAQSDMVIVTPDRPPQNGGGINGLPPVTGGNGGGTNNVPPAKGGANSNWRLLITY
jgi:hypothetical protein